MLDKAPTALSSLVANMTKTQVTQAIESRRQWLTKAVHANENDISLGEMADMSRINSELSQLTNVSLSDDANETLRKLSQPAGEHPGFPGGNRSSNPNNTGTLRKGYWSEPFVKAVAPDGQKLNLTTGSLTVPSLLGGYVPLPDRPILVSQVIPSTTLVDTNQFQYLVEKTRTLSAAETAPGTLKPTTTLQMDKVTGAVTPIATLSQPIDRYTLEDQALLQQYLESSLGMAVALRLDSEIISGNGVAPNILGLTATVGKTTVVYSTNIIQTARKALTAMYALNIMDGLVFVISVNDWEKVELLQSTTGQYVMQPGSNQSPVDLANKRLWGFPVIVSSGLADGNALLFPPAFTHIWEREGVQIDYSTAPIGSVAAHTAFESNEIVGRAEGRWWFASTKPASVIYWATS